MGFWNAVATYAVKAAVYAAGHPDQVKQILKDVTTAGKMVETVNKK